MFMPLIIEGGRVPTRWAERNQHLSGSPGSDRKNSQHVRIAFINNMPDAALEDTEIQFFELLESATGDIPVKVALYSLPGVPRGERAQQYLSNFYFSTDELFGQRFNGMIMTGTEPKQPNMRNEPYWPALASVLDWAESNTTSTILSCLAAHAGVLHSDGISRHPLSDKQFGVFAFDNSVGHALTNGAGGKIRFPHSRWNEVRAEALLAAGYAVLTQSAEGGVDTFIKKKKMSLFLHFQGHPEYSAETLLKEYRRDIKRFLRKERETYPAMPRDYFDDTGAKLATEFRELVFSHRSSANQASDDREELMESFPDAALMKTLRTPWQSSAIAIYGNWLRYIASEQADSSTSSAVAAAGEKFQQKQIALLNTRQRETSRK
jgi:homoserine O-succinyltransferase/O-acetyltransferase